jgi:hypothetical protein
LHGILSKILKEYKMKKRLLWFIAALSVMILNGCSGGSDNDTNVEYSNYNSNQLTTLFLVDDLGFAYADIPYKCDSMYGWSQTAPNGEFSFVEPDSCLFNFEGLDGVYGDAFDDIVRIVDDREDGKGRIPYECASFGVSSTYGDGSFDYNENDACEFYL